MLKEKVDHLGGILDMMTELKVAIMKRRDKMLYKQQDHNGKSQLVDDYRGIVSEILPETSSFFSVTEKLNDMLYNRQVHVLFSKTV